MAFRVGKGSSVGSGLCIKRVDLTKKTGEYLHCNSRIDVLK